MANGSRTYGEDARAHLGEKPPFCNDDVADLFLFGSTGKRHMFRATAHQNAIAAVPRRKLIRT